MELWRLDGQDGSSISVCVASWSGEIDSLDSLAAIEIDTPLRRLTCRGRRASTVSLTRLMAWLVALMEASPTNLRQPIYIDRELGLSMMPLESRGPIQSIEAALGPLPEEEFWDSVVVVLNVPSEDLGRLRNQITSLLATNDSARAT